MPDIEQIKNTELVQNNGNTELVPNEKLLGVYKEVLDNIEADRKETSEMLTMFLDMVINDGEASDATKKAVVDLMKIKIETADKITKIADLMTRIKLKEPDTFPKYLAAQQHNTYNFGKDGETKDLLLQEIEKANKGKKGKKTA
jgi:hypothetical protein